MPQIDGIPPIARESHPLIIWQKILENTNEISSLCAQLEDKEFASQILHVFYALSQDLQESSVPSVPMNAFDNLSASLGFAQKQVELQKLG